jgi:hypothetical protein
VPGVLDAYHLIDPTTGNGLSIAFFEDDADISAVKAVIAEKAESMAPEQRLYGFSWSGADSNRRLPACKIGARRVIGPEGGCLRSSRQWKAVPNSAQLSLSVRSSVASLWPTPLLWLDDLHAPYGDAEGTTGSDRLNR